MDEIKLIVGLGNPGSEYEDTRHNAGFWFVDRLAAAWKTALREERKFSGMAGKVQAEGRAVFLLKPETFMNRSGTAVQAVTSFYKIKPAEILVVHDELDISCGRIKFKKGGGNGGHNGLKDIQSQLGTPDFYRLRLGIGHPGEKGEVIHYVLHKPGKAERELIDDAVVRAVDAVPLLLRGEFAAAQQLLHSKPEDEDRAKGRQ